MSAPATPLGWRLPTLKRVLDLRAAERHEGASRETYEEHQRLVLEKAPWRGIGARQAERPAYVRPRAPENVPALTPGAARGEDGLQKFRVRELVDPAAPSPWAVDSEPAATPPVPAAVAEHRPVSEAPRRSPLFDMVKYRGWRPGQPVGPSEGTKQKHERRQRQEVAPPSAAPSATPPRQPDPTPEPPAVAQAPDPVPPASASPPVMEQPTPAPVRELAAPPSWRPGMPSRGDLLPSDSRPQVDRKKRNLNERDHAPPRVPDPELPNELLTTLVGIGVAGLALDVAEAGMARASAHVAEDTQDGRLRTETFAAWNRSRVDVDRAERHVALLHRNALRLAAKAGYP